MEKLQHNREEIIVKILKNYAFNKGKLKLIDLGAGPQRIKDYLPENIRYFSLDLNKKSNPNIVWDLNKLPLPIKNNSFDIALCAETLEHTFYPRRIMAEIKRIIKPDGAIIITLPNEYSLYLRLKHMLGIRIGDDIPFREDIFLNHIHKGKIEEIIRFYKEFFKIWGIFYSWDTNQKLPIINSIIRGLLRPISKNLFSTCVIIFGKNQK